MAIEDYRIFSCIACFKPYKYRDHYTNSRSFCNKCKKEYDKLDRNFRQTLINHRITLHNYRELESVYGKQCWLHKGGGTICVDHDHKCCPGQYSCGKCIIGLLCRNCNAMLGQYQKVRSLNFLIPEFDAYLALGHFRFITPTKWSNNVKIKTA